MATPVKATATAEIPDALVSNERRRVEGQEPRHRKTRPTARRHHVGRAH